MISCLASPSQSTEGLSIESPPRGSSLGISTSGWIPFSWNRFQTCWPQYWKGLLRARDSKSPPVCKCNISSLRHVEGLVSALPPKIHFRFTMWNPAAKVGTIVVDILFCTHLFAIFVSPPQSLVLVVVEKGRTVLRNTSERLEIGGSNVFPPTGCPHWGVLTLGVKAGSSIEVVSEEFCIFPRNFHTKWLLCHVYMHFDCTSSRKTMWVTCAASSF